jgi:hypothetical protein
MEGKRKTSTRNGAKGNSAKGAKYESQGQALSKAKRVAPGSKN